MTSTNDNIPRKTVVVEDDRTGTSQETLRRAMLDNLFYAQGKFPAIATPYDYYMSLAYTVRYRLLFHVGLLVPFFLPLRAFHYPADAIAQKGAALSQR
jgi:hypothetical protein